MNDATASPPVDDIWATKHPELVAGRGYAWSPKAKPLGSRLNLLRAAIFLFMAGQLFSALVVGLMLYLFQQLADGADMATPMLGFATNVIVLAGAYLGPVSIGIFLFCVVAYLMFVYRGMSNLSLSDARSISMSPGWAVGASFVPFANLALIYAAMRQLWIGSHDPVVGKYRPPMTINIWWACYLLSNFTATFTNTLTPKDADMQFMDPSEYVSAFLPSATTGAISAALALISCFCLLAIIKQVSAAQDSLRNTSAFDE